MRKRFIGGAVWLLLAACLYFFENNTGTRIVLLCSLAAFLLPPVRAAFFGADASRGEDRPMRRTVRSFPRPEEEEPGDVHLYQPGDPVRRIHWKLSAKRGELLIRESEAVTDLREEKRIVPSPEASGKEGFRTRAIWVLIVLALISVALLFLLPQARLGTQALCNRLFAASEAVNAYAYRYYPVPEGQSAALACILLFLFAGALIGLMVISHSRLLPLVLMAACTLFQVYFGLALPAMILVPLYSLFAVLLMRRPLSRNDLLAFGVLVLVLSLVTALLLSGVDPATERASEAVRDHLSELSQSVTGTVAEAPEGETETRHIHPRSLAEGEQAARTGRTFRLVTALEKQISQPQWVDWLKILLLVIFSSLLLILPFTPFLLLNARRKKVREAEKRFQSEDTAEAVRAVFSRVVQWLDATGRDGGNRLYRDWPQTFSGDLPKGYAERFARCAMDVEEAAYSSHPLPEEKRTRALELLRETETALWSAADLKQKILLKYWMCLCE